MNDEEYQKLLESMEMKTFDYEEVLKHKKRLVTEAKKHVLIDTAVAEEGLFI